MTNDPEGILWSKPRLTENECRELVAHLISRLADFLGQPVDLIELDVVDEQSFTSRIGTGIRLGGPLAIEWWGILGMEPIEGRPHVTATLFLYSMRQRLCVDANKAGTIELVFEKAATGHSSWKSLGWSVDEYGEWENVNPPWGTDDEL